jgi:hypothetical protein
VRAGQHAGRHAGRHAGCPRVHWVLDREAAEDLAEVLALLEDFLRRSSSEAVTELAGLRLARPLDPVVWADWLADYLGDQVVALSAAVRAATTPDPATSGDPS